MQKGEHALPRTLRDFRSLQGIPQDRPDRAGVKSPPSANAKKSRRRNSPSVEEGLSDGKPAPAKAVRRPASAKERASNRQSLTAFGIAFNGVSSELAAAVVQQFAAQLAPREVGQVPDAAAADIAICGAPDGDEASAAADSKARRQKTKLHVYLEEFANPSCGAERAGAANLELVASAARRHAFVVQTEALLERCRQERSVGSDGPTEQDQQVLASAIVQIAADNGILPSAFPQCPIEAADLLEARRSAEDTLDLLSKLAWDSKRPPKIISARISREAVEALVEGKPFLPKRKEAIDLADTIGANSENAIDPADTIDAPQSLDAKDGGGERNEASVLSSVLVYWYAKANGATSEEITAVDEYLRQAGLTASSLLSRAGAAVLDASSGDGPSTTPAARNKVAAMRRAKVQLLFLLCCRIAAKRRIRFDVQLCKSVFLALLQTLEYLRSPGLVPVATEEGLDHLSFLISLALPLRRVSYGKNLLHQTMDAIVRHQLHPGLGEDGVWMQGSFEQHCAVLRTVMELASSTRGIKIPVGSELPPTLCKMVSFVQAMVRAGALPPPLDHISLVPLTKLLNSTRRAVPAEPGKKPDSSTHFFPHAGYFISHSTADHGADSSQLAIHVRAGSQGQRRPGRISTGFCMGESELIIGGGLSSRKASAIARVASRTDLATGNDYRVNGESYSTEGSLAPGALSLDHCWEGRGWAAAIFGCRAHANATIRRTALHLKPVHGFIMIDELESVDGGELLFEQFWHLSPHLGQTEGIDFADDSGHFAAAFNAPGQFPVFVETGSEENPVGWTVNKGQQVQPNLYLRRPMRLARGLSVSVFQWNKDVAPLEVCEAVLDADGWSVRATGRGFDVRFAKNGQSLRRVDRPDG